MARSIPPPSKPRPRLKSLPPDKTRGHDTLRPPTLRPPPPSKPPSEGEDDHLAGNVPPPLSSLDEVERALSVLDGRHHDTVRVQRETQRAIAAKRAAFEEDERRADRAQRISSVLRVTGLVAGVVAIVAGGLFGNARYRRTKATDAALASAAAPYIAAGWKSFERPIWRPRERVEATLGANTCVLALASRPVAGGVAGADTVPLTIDRPGGSLAAESSAAYCTCVDEHVIVHTDGDAEAGVLLLHQDASVLGGNGALAFLAPRPTALPVKETCTFDALDPWLAAGHGVSTPTADDVPPATRAAFEASGFKLVASAPATLPFAVVPASADSCFVATTTAAGGDLALRLAGGERALLAAGSIALGWCSHTAQSVSVSRTGAGSIIVYRVDSGFVAGTLGLRELAAKLGLGDLPFWVKTTELGWDASASLLAAGVAPADIVVPTNERPVVHSRVVALTLGDARMKPEPDDLDRYSCAPWLDTNPRTALCVQSSPLSWHATTSPGHAVGVAEAPLPFWMDIMTHVEDARGLAVELQLLTLSRRLAMQRYEPTARVGVLEEPDGIEIVGRAGDDRIIAIGLLSAAPWVLPYTDGPSWSLVDDPHDVPIAAGEHLHLTTHLWVKAPPEVRRTVVFRHRAL
jgi:hypothetical protein